MKKLLYLLLICVMPYSLNAEDWQLVDIPSEKAYAHRKGFATFRCFVKIPRKWQNLTVMLWVDKTDEVDEGYLNGTRIGANGSLDIYSKPSSPIRRPYIIPEDNIKFGGYNLVSIRCLAKKALPAILGSVYLIAGDELIDLKGQWEFRHGDNSGWHKFDSFSLKNYLKNTSKPVGGEGAVTDKKRVLGKTLESTRRLFEGKVHKNARVIGVPLSPLDTLGNLNVKGLQINLAVHEPAVSQPIQVKFDEKGRMWVVQFRQYPEPAGLKTVGMDKHLRKVFDRKLPPPPYKGTEFMGEDKITIHEDKNGDGLFESSKTFVEGLNITTALEFDRHGVWVLSPPHLLFYKDIDKDDVIDSEVPEVHLEGFNLEDTHATANSLTLGPDGWLYGVTGSTTTGSVKVLQNSKHPKVNFFGQTVWRYHRERKVFELFSEGGYNNYGLDFDGRGHVFSGTNTRTSIVHFVQGAYFRKNLGKHGPHNNYYPYELLDILKDNSPQRTRMIHQWLPYMGATIPELRGKFIGPNSLSNLVDVFSVDQLGSTYQCDFEYSLITSKDRWFRPVHVTSGPDGALYISDWYDSRITHLDPRDNWDKKHGRVYRVQKGSSAMPKPLNLSRKSTEDLVSLFLHEDHWYRRTALRLISERQDVSVAGILKVNLEEDKSALESLWALYNLNVLSEDVILVCLKHENESVREWAVRLLSDFEGQEINKEVFGHVLALAEKERSPYVQSQIIASAKRMTYEQSKLILGKVIDRDELAKDPRLPIQVWWALERLISADVKHLLFLSENSNLLNSLMAKNCLSDFIGRRLVSDPTSENLDALVHFLKLENVQFKSNLLKGMKVGSEGRLFALNPDHAKSFDLLIKDETLKARLLGAVYTEEMIAKLARENTVAAKLKLLKSIGVSDSPVVLRESLKLLLSVSDKDKKVLLGFLSYQKSNDIAGFLISNYSKFSDPIKYTVIEALSSRNSWTVSLLQAVKAGDIPKEDLKNEAQLVIQNNSDGKVKELAGAIWVASNSGVDKEVSRVMEILKSGRGNKEAGKTLFAAYCSTCHKLNGPGGFLGPDLSGYELHNLSFIVPAIVNPNLAIREGYELSQIQLKNGLKVSGFVKQQTDSILKIQKLDGQMSVLSKNDILKESKVQKSIMPEGLTKALTQNQVRDLFEYLKSESGGK